MYSFVLHLHSYTRYFILLLFFFIFIRSLYSLIFNPSYLRWDRYGGALLVIFIHVQIVAGFVLYYLSPLVSLSSVALKNDIQRYWTVEHILMMLVASGLSLIGFLKAKRAKSPLHVHKLNFIYQGIAFMVILGTIWMSGRGIL